MACYHISHEDKEFLSSFIRDNAPKSFLENLWKCTQLQSNSASFVNKVSMHLLTFSCETKELILFFKRMKRMIHFFFGPLECIYHEINPAHKKSVMENQSIEFMDYLHKRSYALGGNKQFSSQNQFANNANMPLNDMVFTSQPTMSNGYNYIYNI